MPTEVKLGSTTYKVPLMNVGQIEDLSGLDKADPKWSFKALAVLMGRADPPVGDIRSVEARPTEIRDAIKTIMEASGYDLSPNVVAPEATPGQVDN